MSSPSVVGVLQCDRRHSRWRIPHDSDGCHPASLRPHRPVVARVLVDQCAGARAGVRGVAGRPAGQLASARGRRADVGSRRPRLLGGHSPRRHRRDEPRQRDVPVGQGRHLRKRPRGATRGVAVVSGDGSAPAHLLAQTRQRRVHPTADQADRGLDPGECQDHRRRAQRCGQRSRFRRALRQGVADPHAVGHGRNSGTGTAESGARRRRDGLVGRPGSTSTAANR